jgi:hypothetical protein
LGSSPGDSIGIDFIRYCTQDISGTTLEQGSRMLSKLRFIEAGTYSPYQKSLVNSFIYNKYVRNPSTGLITLATIANELVNDVLMYSESISSINFDDIYDADIVFFSVNTFNAMRSYELALQIKEHSDAMVVLGGMHASLNYT